MNSLSIRSLSVCIAALALGACATTEPPKSGSTSPQGAAPAAKAAGGATDKTPNSYKLVKRNGQDVYCRREEVTGSRTAVREVCLTQAQMEAERRGAVDLIDRARDSIAPDMGKDSSGGRYNSAITQ